MKKGRKPNGNQTAGTGSPWGPSMLLLSEKDAGNGSGNWGKSSKHTPGGFHDIGAKTETVRDALVNREEN